MNGTTCVKCPFDNAGCTPCKDGQFLNSGTCMACPSVCSTCTTGGKCLTCRDGFYFNQNGRCAPLECNQPCSQCYLKGNVSNMCIDCVEGFYLDNYQCKPCITGCADCDYADICTKCQDGYYLTDDGQCMPCLSPCKTCVGPRPTADCRSCLDNYQYFDYYGAC